MNTSPVSPPAVVDQIRGAYRSLSPRERDKIAGFAARARLIHPEADQELGRSGSGAPEGESGARAGWEEELLRQGNEGILVESVTRFLLTEGEPETLAALGAWVAQAKRGAGAGNVPGALRGHPQAALLEALVRGGVLAGSLAELSGPVSKLAAKAEALKTWETFDGLMREIRGSVEQLGAASPVDLGALERKLRRANDAAWALRAYAAPLGTWENAAELRELITATPEAHGMWAEGLAAYLETVPLLHPLRRKREAAECIREAAIGELRNFATLGGEEEVVPGPWQDAASWWGWATGLTDEAFSDLEDWCGTNSLDHLADFIAEAWSARPEHR